MINLLPEEEKKELKREKIFRMLVHFFFLIYLEIFVLGILFFGANYFLKEKIKNLEALIEVQENSLVLDKKEKLKDVVEEIKITNRKLLQVLKSEKEKKKISNILEQFFEIVPERVRLESLNVTFKKDKKIEISFSGIAKDRESLIILKEKLNEKFSDVFFPPQIWFEEENIQFSANFKTK